MTVTLKFTGILLITTCVFFLAANLDRYLGRSQKLDFSQSQFAQIRKGMTESQVIELLGKPDQTTGESLLTSYDFPGCTTVVTNYDYFVWNRDRMYLITITGDRVVRKRIY